MIPEQMAIIQKGSFNDSQNKEDIFAEELSSDCVAILGSCIKNVEKQKFLVKQRKLKTVKVKAKDNCRV